MIGNDPSKELPDPPKVEGHPHLDDEINRNIAQSEKDGGVWLKDVAVGQTLHVFTRNTHYKIHHVSEAEWTIEGSSTYCPTPIVCRIPGSTWGGSMLKMGFVGKGMHLEFALRVDSVGDDRWKVITTSQIQDLQVV